jgi:methyl-accepting chemotaxis protein
MNRLSLKMKLGAGFGSLLLILAVMGMVAYNAVGELTEISDRVVKMMTKKDMASQIEASVEKQSTGIRGFLLAGKEDLLKHDEEGKEEYSENVEKLRQTIVTEEGKRLLAEIQRSYGEFRSRADQEIELRRAGKSKEAEELAFSPETSGIRTSLRAAVGDLVHLEEKLKDDLLKEQSAAESRVRWIVVALAIAGLAVGTLLAVLVGRSIAARSPACWG